MTRTEYLQRARELVLRGTELPHAKLNADKVRMIRRNPHGWPRHRFAALYGVHQRTIDKVAMFQTWRHVT